MKHAQKTQSSDQATVTCHGGAGSVTGANFLFQYEDLSVLIDCGMMQGDENAFDWNRKDFNYDVSSIDFLIVTHAHMDHIGRIPKLIHDGFRGVIYSTLPTRDLAKLMLQDALHLMTQESLQREVEPYFTSEDVSMVFTLWKTVSYHAQVPLSEDCSFQLFDAGHVLGSSMARLTCHESVFLFTGDLGNSPSPLLKDTEIVHGVHYVFMESVYGDRDHEGVSDRALLLERAIEDTERQQGILLIPAFSLERTQELLFELNNLVEGNRIKPIPMYLDSPLGISVTEVYQSSREYFNETVQKAYTHDKDVFSFRNLHITSSVEESKAIFKSPNPKVIIAGSGMSHGGRIIHHELHFLSDPKTILLMVGYQAAGTMGRLLVDGAKKVKIFKEIVPVKAEIRMITGYSGHKGSSELLDFVEKLGNSVSNVYCVMGELSSASFLAQRIRDYLGVKSHVPDEGDVITLPISKKV
ncbi:MAG: MBL fold metallo-hydrolase [Candidatus Pacebacteria bacterium]|nr:MBL fold metallo-hydrolase [Candidatus Paceibacterota bacterium]